MNHYQVVDTATTAIVLRFQEKADQSARARAKRECKVLTSATLELRRHVGPATWKVLGPVLGRQA